MSLINQIEAAYDARPLDKARVPEWETAESGELWIYWKPSTQHELDLVRNEVGDEATGGRWNAQLVVLKALSGDGVRLFSNDHLSRLAQKGYSTVINRLAHLMLKVQTSEDAEKK